MDGVVSNDSIKRRLPPWMLGVAAVDKGKIGDSKNDGNDRDVDDGSGSRDDKEKIKKRRGRKPKLEVAVQGRRVEVSDGLELEPEEEKEGSSALKVKREHRKRTKGKLNLDAEDASKRKKQKGRRSKRTTQSSEDGVTGDCLENGEDEDLTVEDLMVFAKECVQGNIGAKEVESMKEDEFRDIFQSVNSIDVPENKRLCEGQEISSSGITTGNMGVNVTNEVSGFKPSMSGDPAQDMLDLYLGPLLKKTQEKEKKVDITIEEMDFNLEMKGRGGTSAGPGEERGLVTVTKKKSSLRDRVAMFLD